ncbi:MAG TPA: multiheme c-type cytochrome [Longimicrobiales bacterium]
MRGVRFAGLLGMAIFAGALSGCVDERIVYRDKPLFEDPPQAAVGFLGYSNADQKKTACGNCHAGQQVKWAESKHATAWADLQANSHADDTCVDCHTVNALGNAATASVAYAATKDPRYEDVQCESCHGAGLEHVTDASKTQPTASILAGEDKTNGCGECHADSHHPFVEEWEGSRHAEWNDHASSASCLGCHEAKSILKDKFGVTSVYAESSDTAKIGITCAVCHDPHGNGNTAQLRMEASSHTGSTNLCYQCHQRNPLPSGSTSRNYPHSPQGPLVLGDQVGWLPPGFTTDKIIGTHGSEANPGLCVTCHMASYAVNATTNTTGHMFKAIPCKDAEGLLTHDESCDMSARSFKSCLGSGCHGTETAARSAILASETRLTSASAELKRLVALAKAKVPADYKTDTTVTPLEGADFNSQIMEHDLSKGAHNPFYVDALLNASITYIKSYYGVQ